MTVRFPSFCIAAIAVALTGSLLPPSARAQWNGDAGIVVPDYELPDPLRLASGEIITGAQQWPARRAEILELFRENVYGRRPGPPESVRFETVQKDTEAMGGRAMLHRVHVISQIADRRHRFELIVFIPNEAAGPAPLFLLLNHRHPNNTDATREHQEDFWPAEQVIDRGYAVAALQTDALAPDSSERFTEGVIEFFEGAQQQRPDDAWGALAAWGWGASRAMDYFETDDRIDEQRVVVVGHSRGGKAALWAAAEDTRFAMAVSNDSGCGGAALSRRRVGETVAQINRNFPHWFCENFNKYNDNESQLPVDQHMLMSLIAPRALYVASASKDLHADPRGEFLSLAHASPVYALWDDEPIEPGNMPEVDEPLIAPSRGYHIRSGKHDMTDYDWNRFMDLADRLWGD